MVTRKPAKQLPVSGWPAAVLPSSPWCTAPHPGPTRLPPSSLPRAPPPARPPQTGQYSTQIFSLAVLLSSLFVFNQMGGIDEAALDRLSLVTEMTKHIRVRASGGERAGRGVGGEVGASRRLGSGDVFGRVTPLGTLCWWWWWWCRAVAIVSFKADPERDLVSQAAAAAAAAARRWPARRRGRW